MNNIKTQMTQLTELVKDMHTNQRVNGQSKRVSDAKQPFQNTAVYSTQHIPITFSLNMASAITFKTSVTPVLC
jgi:hypothetical protein